MVKLEYHVLPDLEDIKRKRKKLGLTQKALAELVGVSQSAIAKIERGKMIPNYILAKRIFEKLEELEFAGEKKAKDVMNAPVIYVRPEDSVKKAAELLIKHKISQMPVISGGKVVGRINEKILLTKKGEKCGDIMELPYPVVNGETPVSVLREVLAREEMVVVAGKGGKVEGVVTRSDLIRV